MERPYYESDRKVDWMKPEEQSPLDFLAPQTPQHQWMLNYLKDRIKYSEQRMSQFYPRWVENELLMQAYVTLSDYDQILKDRNDRRGGAGEAVEINVPFAWAQVNTIVTYLLHMFGGRNPIFSVGSYRAEQVGPAQSMEMLLQHNADVTKFIKVLYFFLMDAEIYGMAAVRTMWKRTIKTQTVMVPPDPAVASSLASFGIQPQPERRTQEYVSFEGNDTANIDPFMFFPDPRVPMHEVNEKGEFVFWRSFKARHELLRAEAAGQIKWVDRISNQSPMRNGDSNVASMRALRSAGVSQPGENDWGQIGNVTPNYQIDQGTIEIVPSECGLGSSKVPEKWLFSIANGSQIIQAVKLDLPSGKHPIEVTEPSSFGYAFGQLGTVDMLGPMQQMMSWFLNSHIYNVRAALNNQFVVDPTKVEMSDLGNGRPGKLIRLKNTAFGLADPKSAIFQLPVMDITRGHLADFQLFQRLAADLTGATDNVRGLQDAGGRKTATEIRTSSEAGTSRLAAKGKLHSSMALTGLAEQWALNFQQLLTAEQELSVLGADGQRKSVRITPENIQGGFNFPVHDGTLPIDKVGLLDVWRQIFQAVLADPQLRQGYDVMSMFDWICQLGGAQNIQSFKLNVQSQEQQMMALQSGNAVPMDAMMQQLAMGAQ